MKKMCHFVWHGLSVTTLRPMIIVWCRHCILIHCSTIVIAKKHVKMLYKHSMCSVEKVLI